MEMWKAKPFILTFYPHRFFPYIICLSLPPSLFSFYRFMEVWRNQAFFPFSEIEFVIGRERRGERRPKELANVSKWTLNLNYISHALERERCRAPTRENSWIIHFRLYIDIGYAWNNVRYLVLFCIYFLFPALMHFCRCLAYYFFDNLLFFPTINRAHFEQGKIWLFFSAALDSFVICL